MTESAQPGRAIAVVLKGYPRLSETFIAQELRALEARALDLRIVSLRRPTDPHRHPVHDEIRAPVSYLPEYLHREPGRVWRAWRRARRLPGYRTARRLWLRDLRRDPTRSRVRRFGQALVLAHELPREVGRLHAHFLHTPASVARYSARLRGLRWTCSAHAKDIWTTPEWEIREKLAEVGWLAACTAAGRERLAALAPERGRVALVYHGLDMARFPPPPLHGRGGRDGSDPRDPVRLVSVGRAVPKKGYPLLLEALARLPATLHWRLEHIGDGPDLPALKAQADRLGLSSRIAWHGPRPQPDVLACYRRSDIFVLASVVAPDGDRDGLPNVLLEAQSQGLACVATRVSAIPELIEDGRTGRLVAPEDAAALGAALAQMIAEPALRERLGAAGAVAVRQRFSFEAGIDALAERFQLAPAAAVA